MLKTVKEFEHNSLMHTKTKVESIPSTLTLIGMVKRYVKRHPSVVCPAINRRKVRLEKWIEVNLGYKRYSLNRLQSFFVGCELIKSNDVATEKINPKTKLCEWSFKGVDPTGKKVTAHVREESKNSNKLLYYISSYHKEK
jgi:hypothetical protein